MVGGGVVAADAYKELREFAKLVEEFKAKYEISPLQGTQERAGDMANVQYVRGYVGDMSDHIFAILYLYLPKTFSICCETFRT